MAFYQKTILTLKNVEDLEIAVEAKNHAYHTCLAIALLRHHFAEQQEVWELVEQKALSWLYQNRPRRRDGKRSFRRL